MEIYESAIEFLADLPPIRQWPELWSILDIAKSNSPRDWRLPLIACEAVGGKPEKAIAAVAAIACLQISIILIDDMLDADPRGEYHRLGMAEVANLASAFQAAGLEAIASSEAKPTAKLAVIQSLNLMMLKTAMGQYMDVQNPKDEEEYWELIRTKSSPFFGAALYVGALLGDASPVIARQIKYFGHLYGEMIQIHDDLNDTMAIPANPDWTLGRSSLPILYAQIVEHPEKDRFLELRQAISDPETLHEAQNILIRCGAVSYSLDLLLRKYQAAQEILATTALTHRKGLEGILADVIDPVKKLFTAFGIPPTEILLASPDIGF